MEKQNRIFQLVLAVVLLFFGATAVLAKSSEAVFKATIAEINQPENGNGIITVSFFSDSSE